MVVNENFCLANVRMPTPVNINGCILSKRYSVFQIPSVFRDKSWFNRDVYIRAVRCFGILERLE